MTLLLNKKSEAWSDAPSISEPTTSKRQPVRRWVVAGLAFASAAWLIGACTASADDVRSYIGLGISQESISEHVEKRRAELGIPGMTLNIINEGEVVYAETFGHANVEQNIPVTAETIFEGASLSKPVFAQFVMTFVEDGILDLDRPLYEYLPHPEVDGDPRAERITARMVLSHRAGFPNWRANPNNHFVPINFEPGTDYEYSGEGYQYLALVLRHITETDWAGLEALFQQRVAEPLGLTRTVFIQNPETLGNKAEPYDEDGIKIDWRNDPGAVADNEVFVAPASIHTDGADFARWMIAVMNHELLSAESYDELFTRHSSAPPSGVGLSYTLGFYKPHIPFTDFYGHGGNNDGFTSFFMLDPEADWGFVLFTNSEYGEVFGEELFLYLLAGPSVARLATTISAIGFLAATSGVVAFRAIRRRTLGRSTLAL